MTDRLLDFLDMGSPEAIMAARWPMGPIRELAVDIDDQKSRWQPDAPLPATGVRGDRTRPALSRPRPPGKADEAWE
jgi:hypothetical protein